MFKLTKKDVMEEPYPFAYTTSILDEDFYKDLNEQFPTEEWLSGKKASGLQENKGGRIGVTYGQYHKTNFEDFLIHSPAWKELFDYFKSQDSVDYMFDLFEGHFEKWGYIDGEISPPTFDVTRSKSGYITPPHRDVRYHIAPVLIYFDNSKIKKGGDLLIFDAGKMKINDYPQKVSNPSIVHKFSPEPNSGLIWLNTANSYHGTTALEGYRKFCYLAWDSKKSTAWEGFGNKPELAYNPRSKTPWRIWQGRVGKSSRYDV